MAGPTWQQLKPEPSPPSSCGAAQTTLPAHPAHLVCLGPAPVWHHLTSAGLALTNFKLGITGLLRVAGKEPASCGAAPAMGLTLDKNPVPITRGGRFRWERGAEAVR